MMKVGHIKDFWVMLEILTQIWDFDHPGSVNDEIQSNEDILSRLEILTQF